MVEVRQTAAFIVWLGELRDRNARLRIAARIRRLELDSFGDVKPVGKASVRCGSLTVPAIASIS